MHCILNIHLISLYTYASSTSDNTTISVSGLFMPFFLLVSGLSVVLARLLCLFVYDIQCAEFFFFGDSLSYFHTSSFRFTTYFPCLYRYRLSLSICVYSDLCIHISALVCCVQYPSCVPYFFHYLFPKRFSRLIFSVCLCVCILFLYGAQTLIPTHTVWFVCMFNFQFVSAFRCCHMRSFASNKVSRYGTV